MSEAQRALNLLTFQNFHPGGLLPRVIWGGQRTGRGLINNGISSSCDAPCITASMVHAFFSGGNILETLKLNMCAEELIQPLYSPGESERGWMGQPIWDKMPDSPDDVLAIHNATRTYVGRLVPLCRAVLLKGDGILLGDGLTYPHFSGKKTFLPEPTAVVLGTEDNYRLLKYDSLYPLWRNMADILRPYEPSTHDEHVRLGGPISLPNIYLEKQCRLVLCAVWRNQKKIIDATEFSYTIGSELYSPGGLKIYKEGIEFAIHVSKELLKTIKEKSHVQNHLLNVIERQVNIHFWMNLERFLPLLFKSIETPESLWREKWCQKIKEVAIQIYQTDVPALFSSNTRGLYSQGLVALADKFKNQKILKDSLVRGIAL